MHAATPKDIQELAAKRESGQQLTPREQRKIANWEKTEGKFSGIDDVKDRGRGAPVLNNETDGLALNKPGLFSVRCVVQYQKQSAFVERITLWDSISAYEAMKMAEHSIEEYAAQSGGRADPRFAQAYRVTDDRMRQGAEIFSLVRDSDLQPRDYFRRLFHDGVSLPEGPSEFHAVRYVLYSHDHSAFEERITLWKAASVAEAITLAEEELREEYLPVFHRATVAGDPQVCSVVDSPNRQGALVFSLTRSSDLDAEAYLDRFYDTGRERIQ